MRTGHRPTPTKNLTGVHMRVSTFCMAILLSASASAQQPTDDRETDPRVLRKLEWFQDQKFGLLLHWGPYSQWGVVESWSICSEDEPWCRRSMDNYVDYCRAYEGLKKSFSPQNFDPSAWAAAARGAGMRYVVFTTKHHDGFCMFDTKQTDYRVTDPGCAFHADPRANITRQVFDAFREKGFGIGAYFSKPDWHSPYYWNPYWAHADRNVNYSIEMHPDLWSKFRDYTHAQIEELMTGYGTVDILWLDGGWVKPGNRGQDIGMTLLAAMARSHQPGLIIVDRAVGGRHENYQTPEQVVPDHPPATPWETCMTMGMSWSYVPDDVYKPARELIHLLTRVVATGGNFLLNVGPGPLGEFPAAALERLAVIGSWMKINGEAIYGTRSVVPSHEGPLWFTGDTSGAVNAIFLPATADAAPPATVTLSSHLPRAGSRVTMFGVREPLGWRVDGSRVLIEIPEGVRSDPPCQHAWTLRIETPQGSGPR